MSTTFTRSSPATDAGRYRRAVELAGSAAMATAFTAESYAAKWIDDLADDAYEAVDDAHDRDSLHNPQERCNNPHELVPSNLTATQTDAWELVHQLGAWRAVEWEAVLGQGWRPDDTQMNHHNYGSVHGPVVPCLTVPADPSQLPELMLRHLAERVVRLAVERRKAELEAAAAGDEQ